ncbi:uncharacterized protein SPPG_08908 [Spizellomyces punctatus DAOM BR117]|uniref:Uncharacterized protein n=1 Tax=Spizellomyces punctatus (strain DAOM BR117) TaxID=645134 RepID=A0A0L0HRX4_SPIPD|nr:uncharacterized protein SPPG_08908 [Spizellomyces punctatus DAOM BR117]KND03645.1 hypothetical protein SPPG_08908 [Spizellomyces punctatus DAOM BR117]|eukprot:XP_016611684.1 hypothetical protein SPPG_08908 [Spizellomyces punctatus DAOM BR117]
MIRNFKCISFACFEDLLMWIVEWSLKAKHDEKRNEAIGRCPRNTSNEIYTHASRTRQIGTDLQHGDELQMSQLTHGGTDSNTMTNEKGGNCVPALRYRGTVIGLSIGPMAGVRGTNFQHGDERKGS